MECEDETTDTLTQFWILFNEVLQKVSEDATKMFNPFGWMADEAGANWAALVNVFGQGVLSRTIGCQFHFKQSVNRHVNQLDSNKSKAQLKQLANNLMQSATPTVYIKCLGQLKDFISKKPHKRNYLTTWLDWWHLRRFHVFQAFRATDNAPTTNLAESVHSTWKTTQATNITLVDAAYHDIAEAIRIERQVEHYRSGIYQGGTGPSAYSRQQQNYQSQMRRADQYAAELSNASTNFSRQERETAERMYPLDPDCSHRPTKRKQKPHQSTKRTKKTRISSHLTDQEIEQLSSSSEDLPSPTSKTKTKRNARYRGQRSKTFEAPLENAKSMKNTFKLTQTLDLCGEKLYSVTRPAYAHENEAPTYHIKIGNDPSCTCPYAQKSNTVCKHRLWVMLFLLQIPEDSYLLHQKAFTPSEVEQALTDMPRPTTSQQTIQTPVHPPAQQTPTSVSDRAQTSDHDQIFQKHPHHQDTQIWKLCIFKKQPGRNPVCAGCHKHYFTANSPQITVKGLYIPQNNNFSVPRTYHFCVDVNCISRKPPGSNLHCPPVFVEVDGTAVESRDVERAVAAGIPIQ